MTVASLVSTPGAATKPTLEKLAGTRGAHRPPNGKEADVSACSACS